MKIEFVENNYDIGKKLKEIIESKVQKLDRYFGESAEARVVCKLTNKTYKLELTIKNKGMIFRSEVVGENMYENIDLALPKIERQIIRDKKKKQDYFRKAEENQGFAFIEKEEEEFIPQIFKKKSYDLDPILLEDAKDDLMRLGHDFYVFLNAETGKVNVMYKRKDGHLGVIEVNF